MKKQIPRYTRNDGGGFAGNVTLFKEARLAQLVERQFCKLDVAGSIPAAGSRIPHKTHVV
jgi:hypothetical protein